MATGDPLKSTKAIAAAVVAFIAPGAAYLLSVNGDGISGSEWLYAGLWCVASSVAAGGTTWLVENKPKDA